jgi:hypothetical protein
MSGQRPAGRRWTLTDDDMLQQAADFGTEATADCSKAKTLDRSRPFANFPF